MRRLTLWLGGLLIGLLPLLGAAETYGPARPGDSLWRAFGQLEDRAGLDRSSWMLATLRLNPEAFSRPCNANSLRAGARLELPSAAWVQGLSAQAAGEEFQRQAGEWQAYIEGGGEITCSPWLQGLAPPPTPAETVAEAPAASPAGPLEAGPATEPPVAPVTRASEAPTRTPAEPAQAPPAPPAEPVAEPPAPPVTLAKPMEQPPTTAPEPPATPAEPMEDPPTAAPATPTPPPAAAAAAPATPATEPSEAPGDWLGNHYGWRLPLLALVALGVVLLLRAHLRARRAPRIPLAPSSAGAAVRGGFRRRILWMVTLVVVLGQGLYAIVNVNFFQANYLQSVQVQSERLGSYLRQDIEYVLQLGIPLEKLVKIEASLGETLDATPEIEFIEITDLQNRVIYYADHQSMERITDKTRLSGTLNPLEADGGLLEITREDTDLRLPVSDGRTDTVVGYIQMRIAADLIQGTSREIVWDIVTVILVSLLITFEFLGFFVNREFSVPLHNLTRELIQAARRGDAVSAAFRPMMPGIDRVVIHANRWIARGRSADPEAAAPRPSDVDEIDRLAERQAAALPAAAGARQVLARIRERLADWSRARALGSEDEAPRGPLQQAGTGNTPYQYIRPFVFLFFAAYNLPVSFFPMYVETLYEPLWGLPAEVLIGLPISLFMLFFAISMLVVGRWLDRVGWFRPLITGAAIFMLGFVLTAFAETYFELLAFRAMTAVGLGIGFMGFQQFVVENTNPQDRSIGLAAFIGAFFAGEIVGTVIGGMLADRLGYSNIFLLAGVLAGVALAGLVFFFRRHSIDQGARPVKDKIPLAQLLGALRDREFFAVVVFQAIPAKVALVGFLMYFVPLYLTQIGALQSDIGRIAMCYALMLVFIGPLVSRRFGRAKYRKYTILTGGLITGASMTAFALVSDTYAVLMLVIALGIAHAFSLSSQASLIAETRLVQRLGTGTGMGVYRFWERVGNVSGPFIMAGLVAGAGYQQAVVWLGVGTIISSLLYILLLYDIPAGGKAEADSTGKGSLAESST